MQRFLNIFWVRPGACERISDCFALVGKSFSRGLERSSASLCPPHGLLSVGRALRSLGSRSVLSVDDFLKKAVLPNVVIFHVV
jgi:hypothetical protein